MGENSVKKVIKVIKALDIELTKLKVSYDEESDNVIVRFSADDASYAYDTIINALYDEDIYEVDGSVGDTQGKIYLEV